MTTALKLSTRIAPFNMQSTDYSKNLPGATQLDGSKSNFLIYSLGLVPSVICSADCLMSSCLYNDFYVYPSIINFVPCCHCDFLFGINACIQDDNNNSNKKKNKNTN